MDAEVIGGFLALSALTALPPTGVAVAVMNPRAVRMISPRWPESSGNAANFARSHDFKNTRR